MIWYSYMCAFPQFTLPLIQLPRSWANVKQSYLWVAFDQPSTKYNLRSTLLFSHLRDLQNLVSYIARKLIIFTSADRMMADVYKPATNCTFLSRDCYYKARSCYENSVSPSGRLLYDKTNEISDTINAYKTNTSSFLQLTIHRRVMRKC